MAGGGVVDVEEGEGDGDPHGKWLASRLTAEGVNKSTVTALVKIASALSEDDVEELIAKRQLAGWGVGLLVTKLREVAENRASGAVVASNKAAAWEAMVEKSVAERERMKAEQAEFAERMKARKAVNQ